MLRRQIARLDAKGFKPFLASELEFYLFDETFEGAHRKHYQDLTTEGYYIEDYHIFQTSKAEEVMRAMRKGLQAAGFPRTQELREGQECGSTCRSSWWQLH